MHKTGANKFPSGTCPICLKDKRLVLDHCHESNKFRGWICQTCNVAIGLLANDPAIFLRAIDYLRT